jgi:hypothetical protein
MSDGIQPDTVLNVGQIMAEALGKDWCRDRKEIVTYINRFREDLYLMYPEFKLFTNKFYCLELQKFPEECLRTCGCGGATYTGVTIPNDIDGILSVWEDHVPLRTYSKWWEGRVGRITNSEPQTSLSSTLVHQQFPTERNLTRPSKLKIYASSSEDDCKVVIIKAKTLLSKNQEIRCILRGDGIMETKEVVTAIHSVVLPSDLHGTVSLLQDDEYELSEYNSYDIVPSFRRLKINADNCCSKQVLIHGNQKFKPVCFDSDIVEVGSRRIIETAARIYRYGETGTDLAEERKALREEAKLRKLIKGALDRQRGKSSQDSGYFKRGSLIKSVSLPGYSGGGCGRRGGCR